MAEAAEDLTTTSELETSQDPTDAIAELLTGGSDEDSKSTSKGSAKAEDTEEEKDEEAAAEDDDGKQEVEETEEESAEADDEDVTWASALGVPENRIVTDDEGNLSGVNVKIDGKLATVGMNDLIQSYQTSKSNTQKSQTLSEERKEFEGIRDTAAKTYQHNRSCNRSLPPLMKMILCTNRSWTAKRMNSVLRSCVIRPKSSRKPIPHGQTRKWRRRSSPKLVISRLTSTDSLLQSSMA